MIRTLVISVVLAGLGCVVAARWAGARWRKRGKRRARCEPVAVVELRPDTAGWYLRTLQRLQVGHGQAFCVRGGSVSVDRVGRWSYRVQRRARCGARVDLGEYTLSTAHALLLREMEAQHAA